MILAEYFNKWRKANLGGGTNEYTPTQKEAYKAEVTEILTEERGLVETIKRHQEALATLNVNRSKLRLHCSKLNAVVEDIKSKETITLEQSQTCEKIQNSINVELKPLIENVEQTIRSHQEKLSLLLMKQREMEYKEEEAQEVLDELDESNQVVTPLQQIEVTTDGIPLLEMNSQSSFLTTADVYGPPSNMLYVPPSSSTTTTTTASNYGAGVGCMSPEVSSNYGYGIRPETPPVVLV